MIKQNLFFLLLTLQVTSYLSFDEIANQKEKYLANMSMLTHLVDNELVLDSIKNEYSELFGVKLQASSIQEALTAYKNADLEKLAGPFAFLGSNEKIQQKFTEYLKDDVEKHFSYKSVIVEADIKNYYEQVMSLIKQHYVAIMEQNIKNKDATFEIRANVSSALADYITKENINQLLKEMSK